MLNDLLLFNKIKRGDIKSFEKVFRMYYMPLYYYSMSIVKDPDTAEEVVQELFYSIWKNREELKIQQSFKNYLYRSTFNQSIQYLKHHAVKEKYRQYILDNSDNAISSNPQNELEQMELENIITRTIEKLSDRNRKIFLMHKDEGLKYKEIANKLSISIKTVEAEMTKAYKKLREEIEKYINDHEAIKQ